MTFLPIVERELRVAARKRGTFWLRVVAAFVALVIGSGFMLLWLLMSQLPFGGRIQMGSALFSVLTWLSLAAALSAGLFFTSDCLSEEKREGTLGFLFLTDLRGFDVVLGKLLATSLRCVFGLLAIFPVLAITQLMGGVEAVQFWKTLLALTHALFFSLACGMFVSSLSRDAQRAMTATAVVLLLFLACGPGLDAAIAEFSGRSFHPLFSLASPAYVFMRTSAWDGVFWTGLITSQLVAWVLLGLSCVLTPRTWQDKAAKTSAKTSGWSHWWRYGGAKRRASLRRKLMDRNPVMWLVSRERWQSLSIWIFTVLVLGVFIGLSVSKLPPMIWMIWSYIGGPVTALFYLGVSSQAGRFFAEARRSGLIELLLVAPLPAHEMVRGQWRALLRTFAVPVTLFLCVQLVALTLSQRNMWNGVTTTGFGYSGGAITGLAVSLVISTTQVLTTAANLIALMWFGIWMGLTSKNANLATLKTLVFVQLIPWFVISFAANLVGGLLMVSLMVPTLAKGGTPNGMSFMVWYPLASAGLACGLSLAKDIFFALWARRKLYGDFREIAGRAVAPIRLAAAPPIINTKP